MIARAFDWRELLASLLILWLFGAGIAVNVTSLP
jgi:hypothetical protein